VPPPVPTTQPTQVVAPPVDDYHDEDDHRSRRALWILLILLVLALIAGAAYLLPRMFESPPEDVRVPNLIGMTREEARAAIGEAGLAVGDETYRDNEEVKRNEVFEQNPNRDTFVDPGTEVDIVISSGKPLTEVPFVVNLQKKAAGKQLAAANLQPRFEERESDDKAGQVLETDPAAGTQVPEGSVVTVFYSDGPEQVPDVVGLQQKDAERLIKEAGFVPAVVENANTTEPKGTVINQTPAAGQDADQGDTVTIQVSSYEEETTPTDTTSPTDSPSGPTLPTGTRGPAGRLSGGAGRRRGRAGRCTPER
jgi:serine/threonine-protein kinase